MQQAAMKLSPLAMGITVGLICGGAIFLVGLVALAAPGYGEALLSGIASIYPGFDNSGTFGDLLIGTLYFTFDGFCGGLVLAWLYNLVSGLLHRPTNGRDEGSGQGEGNGQDEGNGAGAQSEAVEAGD